MSSINFTTPFYEHLFDYEGSCAFFRKVMKQLSLHCLQSIFVTVQ